MSFRYGEGEPWILKDANFKIEAGESVAVVGASGAGKTTLLKIALGLLQPSEGEVLYGGQRVQHVGIQNFRRQIGTVMQEDVLLTGSWPTTSPSSMCSPTASGSRPAPTWRSCMRTSAACPWATRPRWVTWVRACREGRSSGCFARAFYKQPWSWRWTRRRATWTLNNERAVTAAIAHIPLTRLIIAHRPETIAGAQRVWCRSCRRPAVVG